MAAYLWIALGSALGGVARHWLTGVVTRGFDGALPWGTILVNLTGSFAIGLFAGLTDPDGRWLAAAPGVRQFVMVGLLGGYTTFSAFSLQTLALARNGAWLEATLNVFISVASCVVAVWLGHLAALTFFPRETE